MSVTTPNEISMPHPSQAPGRARAWWIGSVATRTAGVAIACTAMAWAAVAGFAAAVPVLIGLPIVAMVMLLVAGRALRRLAWDETPGAAWAPPRAAAARPTVTGQMVAVTAVGAAITTAAMLVIVAQAATLPADASLDDRAGVGMALWWLITSGLVLLPTGWRATQDTARTTGPSAARGWLTALPVYWTLAGGIIGAVLADATAPLLYGIIAGAAGLLTTWALRRAVV